MSKKTIPNGRSWLEWVKDQKCRHCGIPLSVQNVPISRLKKRENICSLCHGRALRGINTDDYKYALQRDEYIIRSRGKKAVPFIVLTKKEISDTFLFEALEDTEKYRIDQVMSMAGSESNSKVLRQLLVFLLQSWYMLDEDQMVDVINRANDFVSSKSIDAELRARMASDLRQFMKRVGTKEGQQSYEQMRESGREIEAEVPI